MRPRPPWPGEEGSSRKGREAGEWDQENRVRRMSNVLCTRKELLHNCIVHYCPEVRACVMCKHTTEEFQLMANAWQHLSAFTREVFSARVGYDENPEASQMLQVMSVSSFLHFSAKRKLRSDDIYHLEEKGSPSRANDQISG